MHRNPVNLLTDAPLSFASRYEVSPGPRTLRPSSPPLDTLFGSFRSHPSTPGCLDLQVWVDRYDRGSCMDDTRVTRGPLDEGRTEGGHRQKTRDRTSREGGVDVWVPFLGVDPCGPESTRTRHRLSCGPTPDPESFRSPFRPLFYSLCVPHGSVEVVSSWGRVSPPSRRSSTPSLRPSLLPLFSSRSGV